MAYISDGCTVYDLNEEIYGSYYLRAYVFNHKITFAVQKTTSHLYKIGEQNHLGSSLLTFGEFTLGPIKTRWKEGTWSKEFKERVKNLDLEINILALSHRSELARVYCYCLFHELFICPKVVTDDQYGIKELPENEWVRIFLPELWERACVARKAEMGREIKEILEK